MIAAIYAPTAIDPHTAKRK